MQAPARQVRGKVPTSPPDRSGIASGWSVTMQQETTKQTDRTTAIFFTDIDDALPPRTSKKSTMTSHEQGIEQLPTSNFHTAGKPWSVSIHPSLEPASHRFYVCMPGIVFRGLPSHYTVCRISSLIHGMATIAVSHRFSLSAARQRFRVLPKTSETRQRLQGGSCG